MPVVANVGPDVLWPSGNLVEEYELPAIQQYLKVKQEQLSEFEVSTTVGYREPAPSILAEAEQADLVVMTSHGRTGLGKWLLGSVAEKVVRAAPCPVLVLTGRALEEEHPPGFRKILVPLDGSSEAEEALDVALSLLSEGGELILFRGLVTATLDAALPGYSQVFEAERSQVEEYLGRISDRLEVASRTIAVGSTPSQAIVDLAEKEEVDLVAMTTHGRSGFKRWVNGSVTESVMQATTCPLLVVRPNN